MKLYLIVYESISLPGNPWGFGRRAFVDMFVFADSKNQALERAGRYLFHAGWIRVELLNAFERQEPPPSWDERWVKAYRQAEYQGVGFHVGVVPVGQQAQLESDEYPQED